MKKLTLLLALGLFVTFGALNIQTAVASTDNMEVVQKNLDDDPDKNKKAEANVDGKDKKNAKSCDKKKSCCKEASAKKCETDKKACPSECKEGDKKEGGDKK
jgi:hypothetical protein